MAGVDLALRCSCSTDYVEIYSMHCALSASDAVSNEVISNSVVGTSLLGRYCNEQLPGPHISNEDDTALRVVFVSNIDGINSGFKAKYEFVERKSSAKSESVVLRRDVEFYLI